MIKKDELKYDVIVVGAGNAGMVAAATTSKAGLKTLLLEKNNTPGGCAGSFVRGRFEFEPSLHELCSVGTKENPDLIYKIFDELGAKVDWQRDKYLFRSIVKGKDGFDVRIKAGVQGFIDSIEEAVPGSRESLEVLFEIIKLNDEAVAYNDKMKGKPNLLKMVLKYGDFLRSGSHSVNEFMDALGVPKKAQDIINTYWSYLGVPTDELNAFHFFVMCKGYIYEGPVVPMYRSHELAVALIDVLRKNGGELWLNSEVTQFLYNENGKACGVEVNGKKIYAKEIISNVIPNNVYNRSDYKYIPQKAVQLANARDFGLSMMSAYIGLDCSMEELGIKDYTVFVANTPDTRKQFENMQNGALYIVNCLNAIIPDSSPKGTCTLFLTVPALGKDFPKDLQPQDYKKYKSKVLREYLEDFEKVMGIDIFSHIEEIETASPATYARYLGTPEGTAYGYIASDWDNIMARSTANEKPFTIPGLSFCGGHGKMGDGYSSAYSTGQQVGMSVVEKLKGEK